MQNRQSTLFQLQRRTPSIIQGMQSIPKGENSSKDQVASQNKHTRSQKTNRRSCISPPSKQERDQNRSQKAKRSTRSRKSETALEPSCGPTNPRETTSNRRYQMGGLQILAQNPHHKCQENRQNKQDKKTKINTTMMPKSPTDSRNIRNTYSELLKQLFKIQFPRFQKTLQF